MLVAEFHQLDSSYHEHGKIQCSALHVKKVLKKGQERFTDVSNGWKTGKIRRREPTKHLGFMANVGMFNRTTIHRLVREEVMKTLHRQYPMGIPANISPKVAKQALEHGLPL
jgi:hypothetical protein